ncbi:hypothetical protein GCM10011504_03270 [Siccirubricoccus deserti]|uniref:DUF2235 domain-containing protein n=1 Tax=Siccirubricoccus deserti TaxID=2013562 RepID=A0A9X0R1H3_9PROT|nr:DUF2235 domain-containing protein [Siccirubricoccus deserti]MBC4017976.1 DUF2235 domain-containing protein [Siccirubricoccus deserti]GGC28410.1 hypothetical protein GCM10011504_03270 [Siccirubricoccus deserti]
MQTGGIFGGLLAVATALGLLGWWVGRLAVHGCARCLGPVWRLSGERRFRLRLLMFWIATVIVALVLFTVTAAAVLWLAPRGDVGAGWVGWSARALQVVVVLAAALVGALALVSVLRTILATVAAFRRRRTLFGLDGVGPDAPDPLPANAEPALVPPPEGGRRIVICCDGTGNRPDDEEEGLPATTNVWKIHHGLVCDDTQTSWYDPGVATDTSSTAAEAAFSRRVLETVGSRTGGQIAATFGRLRRLIEGATGIGITENIAQAYAEIVRQYRPGDRIYLIGFSRGAYTARCVAGVIGRCGLLRAEYGRYADDVVHLYRTRADPAQVVPVPRSMIHDPDEVRIEFLGLFDTVGSLGVPLWGWWFRVLPIWRNRSLSTDPMAICRYVYHAMAMDERRSQFFPTPFSRPKDTGTRLQQVWFRGAHGDVGGGYAETGLSDITLAWMVEAARRHGLRFNAWIDENRRPSAIARLHDELRRKPSWRLFGSWPRWHPVPGADEPADPAPPGTLHPSVLERMRISHTRLARPDFLRPEPGRPLVIDVEAGREWDRTGIVLDRATYRITYLGGLWRDGEERPCGPGGQPDKEVRLLRRLFGFSRRLPDQPWTQLCAAVAHPREWKLQEYGLWRLLRYLYWRDPEELQGQIASIGADLRDARRSVCLRNDAAPGLLYFFANDLWQTAGNNAGALRLQIERVQQPREREPLWILGESGSWQRRLGMTAGA